MSIFQLIDAIELGIIFGIVAIGIYLTFKIIDFPDLTVDGSFTLGGSVCAVLLVAKCNPFLAIIVASFAGMCAGAITGYLSTKWKILNLLSGILTMTALYSINLRIMNAPNIAFIDEMTIFDYVNSPLLMLIILTVVLVGFLVYLFATNFGLSIRACGNNKILCKIYGINANKLTIITLMISNGIVAFAGSLFIQMQGFADISMGTGTVIVGLAGVIIGTELIKSQKFIFAALACILGSIIYRIALAFALNANVFGLKSSDLNLITTSIVVCTLIVPVLAKKYKLKRV